MSAYSDNMHSSTNHGMAHKGKKQKTITPKDLGQGIMISAFQSRAFGFGMELSEQQLEEINIFHEGKKYADESAAIAK